MTAAAAAAAGTSSSTAATAAIVASGVTSPQGSTPQGESTPAGAGHEGQETKNPDTSAVGLGKTTLAASFLPFLLLS